MKCFLEFYFTLSWDDDDAEWTRKVRDGVTIELGKRDYTDDKSADFDEVQVTCIPDMKRKKLMVTRVGKNESKDDDLRVIGMGQTVEICSGGSFSLMGLGDHVFVRFKKEEDDDDDDQDEDAEKGVFFNGCFYDQDSHSLLRERERHEQLMIQMITKPYHQ